MAANLYYIMNFVFLYAGPGCKNSVRKLGDPEQLAIPLVWQALHNS